MKRKLSQLKIKLYDPDLLMWPGKYGLLASSQGEGQFPMIHPDDWNEATNGLERIARIPSGRKGEPDTFIFSSLRGLGRVEVVYNHGYVWPVLPPAAGRRIMQELVRYVNGRGTEE